MPLQDRTGSSYEQLLAASLRKLGYSYNGDTGKNYLHPSARAGQIIIPDTYIQPDLVVRYDEEIQAIFYVTHWSNTRSSKYKFWRTWEEQAQQKVVLSENFLAINCIFEALPQSYKPAIYITSDDIPLDGNRNNKIPIPFSGWYPAISWSNV